MSGSAAGFAAPVLVVVGEDAEDLVPVLTAGLAEAGVLQPETPWVERFHRHVALALRQQDDDPDGGLDLAVGEFMLWLGHRLHLGHGMLVDAAFARRSSALLAELVARGLVGVVWASRSPGTAPGGWPVLRLDADRLPGDGVDARVEVLDRLGPLTA